MTEVAYHVAGLRQPVVMAVANRALSAPHSRFPEQGDAISQGANGWIQLFCENNQEVLDNTIQAFKIAESCRLPVMVNYEGYIQSHTLEEVNLPDPERIDEFLPHVRQAAMDVNNPRGINTVTSPELYMDYKFHQNEAMNSAVAAIEQMAGEYSKITGQPSPGLLATYRLEGAESAIVLMGSMAGDGRVAVDYLRAQGKKVGLIKVRAWRPFPAEQLRQALRGVKLVTVLDKNIVFGLGGALGTEVRSVLYGFEGPRINSYILGLGGRDVTVSEIIQVAEVSENIAEPQSGSDWFGL